MKPIIRLDKPCSDNFANSRAWLLDSIPARPGRGSTLWQPPLNLGLSEVPHVARLTDAVEISVVLRSRGLGLGRNGMGRDRALKAD